MKFNDLEINQRFELDGEAYVKTSPVLAGKADGGAWNYPEKAGINAEPIGNGSWHSFERGLAFSRAFRGQIAKILCFEGKHLALLCEVLFPAAAV